MKKILMCLALLISSSAFAIGDTDSFYSTSGALVRIGDTEAELLNKMRAHQSPAIEWVQNNRGYSFRAEVYTFSIETMIYKVYISQGKIFKITSNYS
ncbi:hypothetical protein [Acinetobacter sp. MD2(2019)]|uniref:hypothetical protein n=1 Tax=Acinetobacter sp. MD2(2019) TaxID=2605273 RepID=UPI002D1F95E5|nr:hypothetical protein [Acinetobacter sp. MD2(2019)]MEB3753816.1 hypothetical protein [Acinetobacter sp. MD2(2019)]